MIGKQRTITDWGYPFLSRSAVCISQCICFHPFMLSWLPLLSLLTHSLIWWPHSLSSLHFSAPQSWHAYSLSVSTPNLQEKIKMAQLIFFSFLFRIFSFLSSWVDDLISILLSYPYHLHGPGVHVLICPTPVAPISGFIRVTKPPLLSPWPPQCGLYSSLGRRGYQRSHLLRTLSSLPKLPWAPDHPLPLLLFWPGSAHLLKLGCPRLKPAAGQLIQQWNQESSLIPTRLTGSCL